MATAQTVFMSHKLATRRRSLEVVLAFNEGVILDFEGLRAPLLPDHLGGDKGSRTTTFRGVL